MFKNFKIFIGHCNLKIVVQVSLENANFGKCFHSTHSNCVFPEITLNEQKTFLLYNIGIDNIRSICVSKHTNK